MNRETIIRALEGMNLETGSLICLGCAYEDHCSMRGCAVMREAEETLLTLAVENQALRNAANAYKAEAQRCAWISVRDRLPEKRERVLCFYRYEPYSPDVVCEDIYLGGKKWMCETDKVTHWMPLPNPPEDTYE